MTPEQVSTVLLAVTPHVSAFVGRLFGVEKELSDLAAEVKDRSPLWRFKQDFAKKRVLKADAGKAWKGTLAEAGAVATTAISAMSPKDAAAVLKRGTSHLPDEELSVAKAVVLLNEVDDVARKAAKAGGAQWTDELRGRAVALRTALSSSWNASKVSEAACAVGDPHDAHGCRQPEGRGVRARRHRGLARTAQEGSRRPGAPLAVAPRAEEPRLPEPRRAPSPRAEDPRALRRPRPRAPRARWLLAHRPPRRPAHGRAGDRLLPLLPRARQGLVLEGPARQQDRRAEEEPARRRARGLPARREDQRDARHAPRRRRARRARSRVPRQPDVPGHRPPHLQRLHEGLRLPEAGAGQHPADRDARSHRGAPAAVRPRDLRPPRALEPARRSPPVPAPVQRSQRLRRRPRPRRLHARAPSLPRGLRRRRGRRPRRSSRSPSSSSASTRAASTRCRLP